MEESCIPLTSVFKFDHTINNAFRDKSKGHKSKHYWFRYLLGQGLNNHNLTSLSPSIPREISQATMMAGSSRWQSAVIGGNGAWRTRMRTMNLKSNRTCLYRRSDRGPVLNLEYAAPVWSPHTIKYKEIIENVQRRATKMIPGFGDLSYPERLRKLKLPTLAYRRIRGDMIQAFKAMNGFYDPKLPALLIKSTHNHLRGHDKKIFIKSSTKELMRFSFNNRTAKIWNNLPDEIIQSEDIISFEKALDHYWQDQEVLYDDFKTKIKIRCKSCKI